MRVAGVLQGRLSNVHSHLETPCAYRCNGPLCGRRDSFGRDAFLFLVRLMPPNTDAVPRRGIALEIPSTFECLFAYFVGRTVPLTASTSTSTGHTPRNRELNRKPLNDSYAQLRSDTPST